MEIQSKPYLEFLQRACENYRRQLQDERESLFSSFDDPENEFLDVKSEIDLTDYFITSFSTELRNKH